ncbi:hypothetical protein ACSBR2_036710 [Camellia fascicularis]
MISWGHDDYMYLVAKEHGTTLPPAALFIIRYHFFYPLHKSGAYTHLMNADDVENLKWLKIFNKYASIARAKCALMSSRSSYTIFLLLRRWALH